MACSNIFTEKKGMDLMEKLDNDCSCEYDGRKRTWSDVTHSTDQAASRYKAKWSKIINLYKQIKDPEPSRSEYSEDELSPEHLTKFECVDGVSDDPDEPQAKRPRYEKDKRLEYGNDLGMFFGAMETVVAKFPPNKIAEVRANISQIVTETKMQCLREKNNITPR